MPAKGVADLLLAKPTPAVSIDNKGEWMLLSESHSYTAKENLLHLLYERGQWLDKHVKNAGPRLTGF